MRILVQCNLDLVTSNLVTIFQRPFFNLLHKIIRFSDSFCGDQKCHKIEIALYFVTEPYFREGRI